LYIPWPSLLNPKENIAMKKNSPNPNSAPQKKDSITKKNGELGEGELNKVTGGATKEDDETTIRTLPPVLKLEIVEVAAFAASAAAVLLETTITVTLRATRSAIREGARSIWPCAQRYSIAAFRPSS
jgi:hypothetical protein